jgi:hypothetical protein
MPPSLARQVLRACVLKTNAHAPFKQFSHAAYAAAISAFRIVFRKKSEITAIYLRNGMAQAEWVPGLSDIDFTVVLRSDLSAKQEYDFLILFWKQFRVLQSCFPMLGEVEILDEQSLALWFVHSRLHPEPPKWVELHGRKHCDDVADHSRDWRRRALNCAICIYLDYFLPCVAEPVLFTHRQDLQRRARKIMRLLRPIFLDAGLSIEPFLKNDPYDLMATLLVALESAAGLFASDSRHRRFSSSRQANAPISRDGLPKPLCVDVIRSVLRIKEKHTWVLLKDGLEPEHVCSTIRGIRDSQIGGFETAIILPSALFAYVVRDYYPYDYANMERNCQIVFGDDPFNEIAPPAAVSFLNHTLDRIPNILKYPRSEELFSIATRKSKESLDAAMEQALAVQMLLRDGFIFSSWKDIVAQCRSAFPEYLKNLAEIQNYLVNNSSRKAQEDAFHLFQSMATSIQNLLAEKKRKRAAGFSAA